MLKEMLGMAEGILQDLHNDHQEVATMIEKIINTEDSKERGTLFNEMKTMLLAHSHAEQNVLYKKMEKSDDEKSRQFVFEGMNEHKIVEQQLQMLSKPRNKASEQWTAQMTVLKELVNHHVKEEESTGFSCARREFETEELEKLGQQFQRQKEKLMAEA
ncbi:MAG TPA: hemerythrin domain-containing protein [Stellaceae bacterium]|jgi:hemerythrin superfamily protein|nr:hemerythrin domain-containing protein [Stellaceae bacterium]